LNIQKPFEFPLQWEKIVDDASDGIIDQLLRIKPIMDELAVDNFILQGKYFRVTVELK
jgi:hypothetical protein